MISTWSEWKRYPRAGRGENIEAPITPAFMKSALPAPARCTRSARSTMSPRRWRCCRSAPNHGSGAANRRKLPDLEYRTCATSSKADAKAAAERMIGRRETYMSGAA